jgi:hypothetical protein
VLGAAATTWTAGAADVADAATAEPARIDPAADRARIAGMMMVRLMAMALLLLSADAAVR